MRNVAIFFVFVQSMLVAWGFAAASEAGAMTMSGMTGWDVLYAVFQSAPTSVLFVVVALYIAWSVAERVLSYFMEKRPQLILAESQRLQQAWGRIDLLEGHLERAERTAGRSMVIVREVEHALDLCSRDCPKCGEYMDEAYRRATEQLVKRNLATQAEAEDYRRRAMAGANGSQS